MAKRVTSEDILHMNEVYFHCKSYAETARQTGWSASTVSKYVDKNFVPAAANNKKELAGVSNLEQFVLPEQNGQPNLIGFLCELTPKETEDIVNLWKEIIL